MKMRKLKNGKTAGEDDVTGEMVKGGGDMVVDWIWRLFNMAFESGVVPEDWRSAVIVPLYKSKGNMTECKNYRGISLLSVAGKIYTGILVDRVSRVTKGLIDDEEGGYRSERGCVDLIFALKEIGEKVKDVCGFYGPKEGVR